MADTQKTTKLHGVHALGQSIWYDNIRRGIIKSGELQTLIAQGVLGITSNPTIFEKAIGASSDYDAALRQLVAAGTSTPDIYEALVLDDIRAACDLLLPAFHASNSVDGRVSLEVLPNLATNTEQTIAEGLRLSKAVGRPNVMIKVPATPEGLPAIRALTAAGVSVNITLIFGLSEYREVLEAYIEGLEARVAKGESLDGIASVASFFVSRVDTSCDKLLDEKAKAAATPQERASAEALRGKIAIANAKLAYEIWQKSEASPRWKALAARGAHTQRLLWASTGTKDPRYPDTMYLDSLIGPETVNTVPPATLNAFMDHGTLAVTITAGLEEARAQIKAFAALGLDLDRVCRDLVRDGVKSFLSSMETLLQVIGGRRASIAERTSGHQTAELAAADRAAVDAAIAALAAKKAPQLLWSGDPKLFKAKPDADAEKSIRTRLGWLRAPEAMRAKVGELVSFAADVRAAGFTRVLLLGMGGSSLCPEVFARAFHGNTTNGLPLHVLDNTDPAAVTEAERGGDLATTLFIVASKSGGTIEIQSFERHFWDRVLKLRGGDVSRAGAQFVAITDPATRLGQLAEEKKYRRTFINAADIGGRYSALSYFGLVPAALLGIDLGALLDSAVTMAEGSSAHVAATEIPAIELGAIMGVLEARGRDKMTLLVDPEIESLGSWIEQLVAESTGKEGKGVVPVDLEPGGAPEGYGADRLFVRISLGEGAGAARLDETAAALARAGHPVVRLVVPRRAELGREFFRWELATAIAGAVNDVNPFDEPNVTEAKLATGSLLETRAKQGKLPDAENVVTPADAEALRKHVLGAGAGDYIALCAYFLRTDARDRLLAKVRTAARAKTKAATTLGYGPRFLHSTGQLHKGGANNGVFLQLTADVKEDLPIPGEPYTFGTLRDAQALGDLQVLRRRGRRALRVHLGNDIEGGLERLLAALGQG